LWSGYGLGINGSTLFYAAHGSHSWRDQHGNNERMRLTTGADGGLTVSGTGVSSFAGNVGIGTTRPEKKLTVSSAAEHLQLRREETETSGGNLLFLELVQLDSQKRIAEVYPSIRFHHHNKFWHRIEARRDGFHLKDGELSNEAYVNLQVNTITATKFVGDGAVVKGMIVMWSGAINQIPVGWALCDGQNGTPDLRSRFIVGAGPGGNPNYTPGQSGEADTHTHTIALPNSTLTTNVAGSHNHAPPAAWYGRGALNGAMAAGLSWYDAIDRGSPNSVSADRTSTEGNHTHTVAVSIASFNSHPSSGLNRPKWYALCFIIKL
jgi:hypothetical protein